MPRPEVASLAVRVRVMVGWLVYESMTMLPVGAALSRIMVSEKSASAPALSLVLIHVVRVPSVGGSIRPKLRFQFLVVTVACQAVQVARLLEKEIEPTSELKESPRRQLFEMA